MQNNDIYVLTGRGQDELRSGATTLSPSELELLVRIDAVLTIGQIKTGMPAMTGETFTSTFQRLLDRYLLTVAEVDPFSESFKTQMNRLDLSVTEAKADSAAMSLKKAGYYVSIAHKRGPTRPLMPGEVLSAIVVEDEPILAKFIQSYLAFEGFQVRLAGNRAEVIAEFLKLPVPDLILLDVMLPGMDGPSTLKALRGLAPLAAVPVAFMTAKVQPQEVAHYKSLGARGVIAKPFDPMNLANQVRAIWESIV